MSQIYTLGSMVRETLLPLEARSADAIGPAIDISSYTGAVAVTLNSTAATDGTLEGNKDS